jgi:16S rRNA (adenine1518-N6/adenine1519-N6)-dimethyltransferase
MEHLAPRKSLGQNFLVDQNIARKIVETFAPRPDEPVVEIGPGQGALTGLLIERGARVLAVELDPRMAARIRELYADRVEVIEQDVLKINFAALAQAHNLERLRVIGNIPYYITSPILFRLIEFREVITEAMLMMQREVAMRLVAKGRTKDSGILSIMSQT